MAAANFDLKRYDFTPMTLTDLPLIKRWLETPHVSEWWHDPAEQFDLVSGDLDDPDMAQFIVATAARPLACLQGYDSSVWDSGFGPHPDGTRGIDQFIGEPDMVNRGHGSAFIKAFVGGLIADGAPRIITDPDPANARAVRAYEKAGFQRDREVDTPDGRALLMVRNA